MLQQEEIKKISEYLCTPLAANNYRIEVGRGKNFAASLTIPDSGRDDKLFHLYVIHQVVRWASEQ